MRAQVFPHHLAGHVTRVMRVTPFKYYSEMLVAALVAEKPYHQIPNFTVCGCCRNLATPHHTTPPLLLLLLLPLHACTTLLRLVGS